MSNRTTATTTTTPQHTTHLPHDKIAMRAYEKWCKRGRPQGTDRQDWLEAETELRKELTGTHAMPGQQAQTTQQRR